MENILSLDQVRSQAPSVFTSERKPGLSDRYQPFCTAEVIKPVLEDGWQIVQAGQSTSRSAENRFFKRHLLRLSHPDLASLSSEFRIDALISNSNDGTRSFKVELGVYRFVCANGIVDGEEFDAVSVRHLYPAEKVQAACEKIIERAPAIAGHLADWKSFQLSIDQESAFVKHATNLRFGDADASRPNLNVARRDQDVGHDLWRTFQRLQESCLRGGQYYRTASGRLTKTREIRSIDTNLRLNRRLWSAAETIYRGDDLALAS